jgi:hypothetical protein
MAHLEKRLFSSIIQRKNAKLFDGDCPFSLNLMEGRQRAASGRGEDGDHAAGEACMSLDTPQLAAAITRICGHAIRVGAPLYNAGYAEKTVNIYRFAHHLLHQLPFPAEVSGLLDDGERLAQRQVAYVRQAWALRRPLDALLLAVKKHHQTLVGEGAHSSESCRLGSKRACIQGDMRCNLFAMPHEILLIILSHLDALTLGHCICTCRSLNKECLAIAEMHVLARPHLLPKARVTSSSSLPCWPRALFALERLEAAVGPMPASRSWWHEWEPLRMLEVKLTLPQSAAQQLTSDRFRPGGDKAVLPLLRHYASGLSWMLHAGWPICDAAAVMLLSAYGPAAMGHAVRERSPVLAASAHMLSSALFSRAWQISSPAPLTYASIHGCFGLLVSDPVWASLLSPEAEPGLKFTTSGPLLANDAMNMPDEKPGVQVPVFRLASAGCELRDGEPVVCFRSEYRTGGMLRTLIQTSPTGYALPPLVDVEVEAIHESGSWLVLGMPVRRKVFIVTVSMPY